MTENEKSTIEYKKVETYFILLYQRKEKENENDLKFIDIKEAPKFIHNIETQENFENQENPIFFYIKVFKFIRKQKKKDIENKKAINFSFQFEIGQDNYDISFEAKDNTFIYDIFLKTGKKMLKTLTRKEIKQDVIDYSRKMEIFLEALKSDENLKKQLYEETIELYKKKKGFSFLLSLFINVYEDKDLCSKLTGIFTEMNIKNENEKNLDRYDKLEKYISTINKIASNANTIIEKNGYKAEEFYGIIFCYLNYYDNDNFKKYFKDIYKSNSKIVYEILLIYFSNFKEPNKENEIDGFFDKFVEYAAQNKTYSNFTNGINLIIDYETFITAINKNKEIIIQMYANSENKKENSFSPIKLDDKLEVIKKENSKELDIIIPAIEDILNFSKEKNMLLIYFTTNFWIKILQCYNIPDDININNCFKLREIFLEYYKVVNDLFKNENVKKRKKGGRNEEKGNDDNMVESKIKEEALRYFERDEFAFILNKIINNYLVNNKDLTNAEILSFIRDFNPYYKEEKFSLKRDSDIFDMIDLEKSDEQFFDTFKKADFENVFKDKINDFLNKMDSKIKSIDDFKIIMKLIDIEKIKKLDKINYYLDLLKTKYEYILKKELESSKRELDYLKQQKPKNESKSSNKDISIKEQKLKNVVNITCEFFHLIFKYDKIDFIKEKIIELDESIPPFIYNELIKDCKGDEYKPLKDFIFENILNKLDNIDTIIALIKSLKEPKDKNTFLGQLMNKYLFTKDEFFSNKENRKISLLYNLYKNKILENNKEKYYKKIDELLTRIRKDIDGDIKKKKLEEFLENKKDVVKRRLSLIKIILNDYEPEQIFEDLKKKVKCINEDIEILNEIKKYLIIFHQNKHRNDINKMTEIIKDLEEGKIKEYEKQKYKEDIQNLKKLKIYAEQIKKVKDLLLFDVLFNETKGKDQCSRFETALKQLDNFKNLFKEKKDLNQIIKNKNYNKIFQIIKKKLSYNDNKANKFIEDMKNYFDIRDQDLINKLIIIINSKKYEIHIQSIIFFFRSFQLDNKMWNNIFSEENIRFSSSEIDIKDLEYLKKNKIYDYNEANYYSKFFTSLYNKRKAIDFLLKKTSKDIKKLYEKIEPSNRILTIKDIEETEKCVKIFDKIKNLKDNFEILEKIKMFSKDDVDKFEKYSKIYTSIIELDRKNSSSKCLFEQVDSIIQYAILTLKQDFEDFIYYDKKDKMTPISIEILIHLKNQIYIKVEKESIRKGNEDELQIKIYKLKFFKDIISNLEIIYDQMKKLRLKGSNLPIIITIEMKYPDYSYYLQNKKVDFTKIKEFLLKANKDYKKQLDLLYKTHPNLRFLYGKQFQSIKKHLNSDYDINSFMRYILNKTNNNENVKDGVRVITILNDDYVEGYNLYNECCLIAISDYLTSLFDRNENSLQKHYNNISIKNNKIKGMYYKNCKKEEMEAFILTIFLELVHKKPIAQNILITSKETNSEEIQAFFYRAILCSFNTLFIVEINDSFSQLQQSIMYNSINQLLVYQMKKKDSKAKEIKNFLDSCIIFIYEDNIRNNTFKNEMKKLDVPELNLVLEGENEEEKSKIDNLKNSLTNSVKVIISDFCGLGKTFKIKKMIKENKKKYIHFPLGGILSKSIIYEKLKKLLEKIDNEKEKTKYNYEDIAIHLDLTETKETSIINEFFFSFFITKFYTNNENIIYIPEDIEIYVEIPNCFDNYLSKFGILKEFNQENIKLDNKLPLELESNIISIFRRILDFSNNKKIEAFIKKYIGIKKYSYHQVHLFIKLFISQFKKFDSKLIFLRNKEDITEECIQDFANSTKYFIDGSFPKLLMGDIEKKDKNYYQLLSEAYDNDFNNITFDKPLIFINKEKNIYKNIILNKNYNEEHKSYLQILKEILNLPNEVEKKEGNLKSLISIIEDDNYVITSDNFKKMILIVYRINANIPVILMEETGYGKTSLIIKLNQILNNGETTLEVFNMHPGITDKDIYIKMDEINKKAKKKKKQKKKKKYGFFLMKSIPVYHYV